MWFRSATSATATSGPARADLGIFDQAAWLLAHGHAPYVTSIGLNVFADHVSPVVLLFAPLYWLAATPVWWLAAQAACLGLTIVPMRRLAADLGAPPWAATAAIVLSAPLLSAAVYDVHPVVFATPAVAWALLAGRRDDVRAATIAGIIVVLVPGRRGDRAGRCGDREQAGGPETAAAARPVAARCSASRCRTCSAPGRRSTATTTTSAPAGVTPC